MQSVTSFKSVKSYCQAAPAAALPLIICAAASNGWAAPATLPQLIVTGLGAMSWFVTDQGGTTTGEPFSGVCNEASGLVILDANSAANADDAYDFAYSVFVDGTIFTPGGTVDLTGTTLTAGPVAIAGLDVTVEYFFSANRQVARVVVFATNPTGASIAVPVEVPVNFGSDVSTTIEATSSGDTSVTAADRWVVSSEGEPPSDAVNTTVLYGSGSPAVTPASVTQAVFDCVGTDGLGTTFNITVPAGQTRSLMLFGGLGDIEGQGNTIAGAIANAAQFNANTTLGADLLNGLSATQLAEILNWDFGTSALTCYGLTPTLMGTPGNDRLRGTARSDVILGLGGNDIITGLASSDRICGGVGRDSLDGGNGNDRLSGEADNDSLVGGNGNDLLNGGAGRDLLSGGNNNDTLDGGHSADECRGGAGADTAVECETVSGVP